MEPVAQSPFDSVRTFLAAVKAGNTTDAVEGLWDRFYSRIVEFAKHQLHGRRYAIKDEDDIATDTFYAFFVGARLGEFHDVKSREDAWQIMQMIASRRIADLTRSENRRKRGGGRLRVALPAVEFRGTSVEDLVGYNDLLAHLLQELPDAAHAEVAYMKISGFTLEQIAAEPGMSSGRVEAMLAVIRKTWRKEFIPDGDLVLK